MCLLKDNVEQLEQKLLTGRKDVFVALEKKEETETEARQWKDSYLRVERERVRQKEEIKKLHAILQKVQRSTECIICNEDYCTVTLIPCKHQILCSQCADKVDVCPICRAGIQARVQSYTNFSGQFQKQNQTQKV